MPYISSKTRRMEMDKIFELMLKERVRADGDLNYLLFKYCKYNIPMTYGSIKNYCGELHQCATEIERRLMGPLEEKKIDENGDV